MEVRILLNFYSHAELVNNVLYEVINLLGTTSKVQRLLKEETYGILLQTPIPLKWKLTIRLKLNRPYLCTSIWMNLSEIIIHTNVSNERQKHILQIG